MLAAGVLLLRVFHRPVLGSVLIAAAVATGIAVQVSPKFEAASDRLLQRLVLWTGVALNWIVFTLLFILLFLPGRLILALTRNDPMRRACPTSEPTYWLQSAEVGDTQRQY